MPAFIALWGVPGIAMIAAIGLGPQLRAVIWTVMLLVMGMACIANARRCGRTHCRFTGPFLIVMAMLVVGHATGILPLGRYGWAILGGATLGGFAALWWGSERALGMFSQRDEG